MIGTLLHSLSYGGVCTSQVAMFIVILLRGTSKICLLDAEINNDRLMISSHRITSGILSDNFLPKKIIDRPHEIESVPVYLVQQLLFPVLRPTYSIVFYTVSLEIFRLKDGGSMRRTGVGRLSPSAD